MKSVNVLVATAGLAAAQVATITADVASISSAVANLNSQVSAFSQLSQASAIVDSSSNIVSLINKAESDAANGGSISGTDAVVLLDPFSSLAAVVTAVVENLVGRSSVANSLSLGNVIENQLVSQSSAAVAFASALEAQLPPAFAGVASGLAASIVDELASGIAAFSGASGPTTIPSGSGPSSGSAGMTTSTSVGSVSTSVGGSTPAVYTSTSVMMTSVTGTGSSPTSTGSSNGTVTSPTPSTSSVTPSQGGAEKAVVGFASIAGAALLAMLAL